MNMKEQSGLIARLLLLDEGNDGGLNVVGEVVELLKPRVLAELHRRDLKKALDSIF